MGDKNEIYLDWIDVALGNETLSTNEIYDKLRAKYKKSPTINQLKNFLGKNPKRFVKLETIRIKNNTVSFWRRNE